MLVIGSLLPPDKQSLILADKLGDGRDGEVYALQYLSTVVKFSVIFDLGFNGAEVLQARYYDLERVLAFIENCSPSYIVSILDHKLLHQGVRATVDGEQPYLVHCAVMERLNKLTEDEKKVFHSILSHEDANIKKLFGRDRLQEILDGLTTGLSFDREQVESFYYAVLAGSLYHDDIHPRNIMKSDDGIFKLVDLDHLTFN
jgi:hypothetical protein